MKNQDNKNPNENIVSKKVYEVARPMTVKAYTGDSDCQHYLTADQAIKIINDIANLLDALVIRQTFDIEEHEGRYFIYTSEWVNGNNVWTANELPKKRLNEIAKQINKLGI